jgi:hypothetical protein
MWYCKPCIKREVRISRFFILSLLALATFVGMMTSITSCFVSTHVARVPYSSQARDIAAAAGTTCVKCGTDTTSRQWFNCKDKIYLQFFFLRFSNTPFHAHPYRAPRLAQQHALTSRIRCRPHRRCDAVRAFDPPRFSIFNRPITNPDPAAWKFALRSIGKNYTLVPSEETDATSCPVTPVSRSPWPRTRKPRC